MELGYGTGRILFEVAKAGYEIYGIDISDSMYIQYLRNRAAHTAEVNNRIKTFKQNMIDFTFDETFGLIMIPFRSFACLLFKEDRFNCLLNIKKHMSPDATCIISLSFAINPLTEKWLQPEEKFDWETIDKDGTLLKRYSQRKAIDKTHNTMLVDLTYRRYKADILSEETVENIAIAYITRGEFETMANEAGLEIVNEFGGFDYCPMGGGNREMIFVLKKS